MTNGQGRKGLQWSSQATHVQLRAPPLSHHFITFPKRPNTQTLHTCVGVSEGISSATTLRMACAPATTASARPWWWGCCCCPAALLDPGTDGTDEEEEAAADVALPLVVVVVVVVEVVLSLVHTRWKLCR